ncbi:MAG: hypothetical protein P4L69_07025 [Desulfosporosinus sp.]|nr:hypothetical protein [Desulfosporosinus sp.]
MIYDHAEELAFHYLAHIVPDPLTTACKIGRPLYVDICLRHHLDPYPVWAFLAACQYRHRWVVELLLSRPEYNYFRGSVERGLWYATTSGDIEIAKLMIEHGAVMVGSALAMLELRPLPKEGREIRAYLSSLMGQTNSNGDRYF